MQERRFLCSPDYEPDAIYEAWLLSLHATTVRIPRSASTWGISLDPHNPCDMDASERPAIMTEELEHVISWRGGVEMARVSSVQGLRCSAADREGRD